MREGVFFWRTASEDLERVGAHTAGTIGTLAEFGDRLVVDFGDRAAGQDVVELVD